MTETSARTLDSATAKKRGGGLNTMLLADLKQMAGSLGIAGAKSMKKADLVDAIKGAQQGPPKADRSTAAEPTGATEPAPPTVTTRTRAPRNRPSREQPGASFDQPDTSFDQPDTSSEPSAPAQETAPVADPVVADLPVEQETPPSDQPQRGGQQRERQAREDQPQRNGQQNGQQNSQQNGQPTQAPPAQSGQAVPPGQPGEADGEGRRNRRRRGRDRDRTRTATPGTPGAPNGPSPAGQRTNEPDTTILDDDVLVPAAGILDVLDNYAFVRTSGYLPGPDDVYVSLSMVRRLGLRRGDAITGEVRQPREGERKEKFNPMVRIDSVNGADPEAIKDRVEFSELTPLHPTERLRLETDPGNLIGRIIDLAAPVGKGQRGLIVSPSKAGKTMVMQSIANSITTNNPECHLMVVLVDERPEEVTDFERSVKGEVIASTFDRPASDHTLVAELAIERAQRLVELGHDVVVLLDGITRLGRAYNLATPVSGRILPGGVDSAALHPPKKFFGAARNIESGGSLTIIATALVESGSRMDEVIFEEFEGTGNMEVRLRREFADKQIFPAIDAVRSGTRREDLLLSEEELSIVWKLRRVLSGLEGQQALELLLTRLSKTQTNIEFLMQVQRSTPDAIH